MTVPFLPPQVLKTAIHSGQELGWRVKDFPAAVSGAAAAGMACIGGQFQWVLPDGTCEAYWLNADASPHESEETWPAFVARCERQILEGFNRLVSSVNFDAEADRFEFLLAKKAQGLFLPDYLLFVAYFANEAQYA